ncbi:MAG: hypothetical protein P8L85_24495 [Rubripirellula sp.]|nr:hypothetical protein [Rubripirellula sp.]
MIRSAKWALPLLAAIFCSGCGIEPETIAKLQKAVKATTAQPDELESDAPVVEVEEVAYSTPYPSRDDPFAFAMQASEPREIGVVRPPTAEEVAVHILGFADVHRPCVLLQIDGETHMMKVGDRVSLVEVIAIRPPAADLRVGTLLRTVTMFDPH